MYRCGRCEKGAQVGMNVSHSHIRTKKRNLPNLHTFKVREGGKTARAYYCTKCLRIVKKELQAKRPGKTEAIKEKATLPI